MLYTIVLLLGILAVLGEIVFISLWIGTRWRYRKEQLSSYAPKTCIFIPCKGTTEDFKENIKAICSQHYKNYTMVFITDSTTDPAYIELKKILKKNPNARIEITEVLKGCSGKIAALITGINTIENHEVYVFADSDIRPHKDWLRQLVSPLKDIKIGATTGFRWYFPTNRESLLLSTWNLASILFLSYSTFNYAWGGSTAIRKQVFEELDIVTKWRSGFSDDLILTKVVKQAGLKIKFVPKCVVESFDDADIHTFFKWGTTQFTWIRWYYPFIWVISFIGLVGLKALTVLSPGLFITGFLLPGLLMISTIFFEMIYGWLGFITLKKIMWYPQERYSNVIGYALMMPVVFFLMTYNMIASLFKKEIMWKGRKYVESEP